MDRGSVLEEHEVLPAPLDGVVNRTELAVFWIEIRHPCLT